MTDEQLQIFCRVIGWGRKLQIAHRIRSGLPMVGADAEFLDQLEHGIGTEGEYIEAMRAEAPRLARTLSREQQHMLISALEDMGITLDLTPPSNEGGSKP